jgi:AGCS family alanine or glycine:cation symporter
MEIINKYLSGTLVPIAIFFYSVFFLIKLHGRPIINPLIVIKSIFKKKSENGISPIKAVIFALAGTLGVGNILGVASAIALGGAGAVFWMWVSAFLAMILKYSEVVLAVLHRRTRNGENYGGAMYYMKDFFASKKKNFVGIIYTFIFSALCLVNGFTMGSIIQSNAIAKSFATSGHINALVVGVILAILSIIVFLFNGKKVFSLCEKLVPFVSILYVAMCLIVVFKSYERVPNVFFEIFKDAFSITAISGGGVGFLVSNALRYGTIRGLFSNEAGCGTSPIAHATSNTDSACEQGFLGIIEVFIDTIIVCTVTALVILLNKEVAFEFIQEPMIMVFSAFSVSLGNISYILLSISVFLFAFATIICWGYYGKECLYFIKKDKKVEKCYYCFYIITVFIGTLISLDMIWQLADFAVGVMTLMNLFILGNMNKEIKKETFKYFKKRSSPRKL